MKDEFFSHLDNFIGFVHNVAVNDLHKTGDVQYTKFNRFLFKIEETLDAFHYEHYWKYIEAEEKQLLEQQIKNDVSKEIDDVSEEIYVKTNIGTMPIEDYYEIRAIQYGFDDYMSMVKAGYHFDISDIDPESLVVKEKYHPASEKDEITQMLDSLSDKADKVIDSIDKDITKMAEKGEMEWEI